VTERDATRLTHQLSGIVIRGLAAGHPVEIDGLGTFHPDPDLGCRFEAFSVPRVFIAYAKEDSDAVERLYNTLDAYGFQPWMDTRRLLPGQNWPRAIESAIENSDFFVACFSQASVNKKGGFQAEIRYALDCARHMPLEEMFIVPVRLNECRVPRSIQREIQYIDLFPNWSAGIRRLTAAIQTESDRRAGLG
jgi:hypothetical protein